MAQLPNNPKTGKPFKSDEDLQNFIRNFLLKGPTEKEIAEMAQKQHMSNEPVLIDSGGTGKIVPAKDVRRVRQQDKLRAAREQYEQNKAFMDAVFTLIGGGRGPAKPTRPLPRGMRGKFVKTFADLSKHQPKTAAKIEADMDAKQASRSPRQPAKKAGSPPRIVDQPKEPKSVKEPPSVFERISTQVTESFEKQRAIHKKANDAYNKLERLRKQLPRPKQEVIDKAEADYKKAEAEARTALKAEQTRIAKAEKEGRQYERTRAPIRKKLEPKRPEAEGKTMTVRGKRPSPRVASQPRPTDKPKLSIGMDGVVRKPEQSRPKPPEPPKDGVRRKPEQSRPKLRLVPEPKPVEMPKRKPMDQAKLDTIKKLREQNPANLIYGKKDPPKSEMASPKMPNFKREYEPTLLTDTPVVRGPTGKKLTKTQYKQVFDALKKGEHPFLKDSQGKPLGLTYESLAEMMQNLSPVDQIILGAYLSKADIRDATPMRIDPQTGMPDITYRAPFVRHPTFPGADKGTDAPERFHQKIGDIFAQNYPETVGMTEKQRNKFLSDLTGGNIAPETFEEVLMPSYFRKSKGALAHMHQDKVNIARPREMGINIDSPIMGHDPALRSAVLHEVTHAGDPTLHAGTKEFNRLKKIRDNKSLPMRKRVAAGVKLANQNLAFGLGFPHHKIPLAALIHAKNVDVATKRKAKKSLNVPKGIIGKIAYSIPTLKDIGLKFQDNFQIVSKALTYYASQPEILTHWLGPTRRHLSRAVIDGKRKTIKTREDLLERLEATENNPKAYDDWIKEMKMNMAVPKNAPPKVQKAYELFLYQLFQQIKTDKKMQDMMLERTVKADEQPPRSMPA